MSQYPFNKRFVGTILSLGLWLLLVPDVLAQHQGKTVTEAAAAAVRAGISHETINRLLTRVYETGVDSASAAALLDVLTFVQREGMPLYPFKSKIEEGIAKGIPAFRIQEVLEDKFADYRFVRLALQTHMRNKGEDFSSSDLSFIAESLRLGISKKELSDILHHGSSASPSEVARALEIHATLKQIRFDPRLSEEIVHSAMRCDFFNKRRIEFAKTLTSAKRKGISDDKTSRIAVKIIRDRGRVSEISAALGLRREDLNFGPRVGVQTSHESRPESMEAPPNPDPESLAPPTEGGIDDVPDGSLDGIPDGSLEGVPDGSLDSAFGGGFNGDPDGTPDGAPAGVPDGGPAGVPDGSPSDVPDGDPAGVPDGSPSGDPDGGPGGVPNGVSISVPGGVTDGVTGGVPNGDPGSASIDGPR